MPMDSVIFIILASGFIAALIIYVFFFSVSMIIRPGRGKSSKKNAISDASETKMIQEIYHSLSKMEARIDSLETILLSKEEHQAEEKKLHDFERKIERG